MDSSIALAGILGLALISAVTIYSVTRLRIEQERTLQKLIDRGASSDELSRVAGLADRPRRDLRRGTLLVAVGVSWAVVTYFIGGKAWMLGVVPVALGLALIGLGMVDDRSRG